MTGLAPAQQFEVGIEEKKRICEILLRNRHDVRYAHFLQNSSVKQDIVHLQIYNSFLKRIENIFQALAAIYQNNIEAVRQGRNMRPVIDAEKHGLLIGLRQMMQMFWTAQIYIAGLWEIILSRIQGHGIYIHTHIKAADFFHIYVVCDI